MSEEGHAGFVIYKKSQVSIDLFTYSFFFFFFFFFFFLFFFLFFFHGSHFTLKYSGGHVCVCDFTVDETQGWGMQTMWSKIFASDHVYLRAEHRPYLREQFKTIHDELGFGAFPYVPPVMRAPWYVFVGQKE